MVLAPKHHRPCHCHHRPPLSKLMSDYVEAPRHCRAIRGRPTVLRHHLLLCRGQGPHTNEWRQTMSRGLLIFMQSGGSTSSCEHWMTLFFSSRNHGATNGAKMPGYRQRLPSEEEEEWANHPTGKMRSVPKWTRNKWTRVIHDGRRGLRRQRVWLVMSAGGGKSKRGGEHNN